MENRSPAEIYDARKGVEGPVHLIEGVWYQAVTYISQLQLPRIFKVDRSGVANTPNTFQATRLVFQGKAVVQLEKA